MYLEIFRHLLEIWLIGLYCFNDGNVTADNCIQGGTKKTSAKMKMLLTVKGKCFGVLQGFWKCIEN